MAVYDDNWKSYAMYTTCTVESGADYGCIEKGAMAGIGIAQWTYGRSWTLLNLMVTDYPDTASMFPILYEQIKPGSSSWNQKVFNQREANEISSALVTQQGVATQDKLWNRDCDEDYIPLLRDRCNLTDPWGSVYAITIYHQSPRAFWQVYSAVGNGTKEEWYTGAINNGIVGKYKNRQDTVKRLLDEWDGSSAKEGFGTTDPDIFEGGDFDPNYGNPDDTFAETLSKVQISSLQMLKKELVLNLNVNGEARKLMFYRSATGLYYPVSRAEEVKGETVTDTIPPIPEVGGTNEDIEWIMNKMVELSGTLGYSQAQSLRTNIEGGFADCSGLAWWLYKQRGYNIGTSTWTQVEDGDLIIRGNTGEQPDLNLMQKGDLCLFRWPNGYQHVELYNGDGTTWGHGGNPYFGPTNKELSGQINACQWYMIRRIIKI